MRLLKYEPLIKGVGFNPAPLATYGIPSFADSAANPDVIGTLAHEDYWAEQFDRCVNGYDTGGLHIPGRYYYYLNFCMLETNDRGEHLPEYVDLDLEFFKLVDDCKKNYKGIICLKRRRAGVSYKFAHGVFGYGLRFYPSSYRGGVVAGLSDYSDDFFKKFKDCNSRMPPEMQISALADNQEEWTAGYEIRSQAGGWMKDGSFNTIYCRTAGGSENVFKGKRLNDCGFEEGGEFKNLVKCFSATKQCFSSSHGRMTGTPYVWGTGGNIKSSSKGFKEMLANAHNYDLVPFEIMGPRIQVGFFVGSINEKGEREETVPNIASKYPDHSPEQLLGCEDTEAATSFIMQRRAFLAKGENKEAYYEFFQDNPLDIKEAFLNFSANEFSPEILAEQIANIQFLLEPRYKRVKLKWVLDEKTKERVVPFKVEWELAKDTDKDEDCVLMLEEPVLGYKDLDIAGCDSYDLDKSSTSKSLGAFVIVRRRDIASGKPVRRPILLIRTRPKRKEEFYDTCLKAAVMYNLTGNVLIDIANGLIFEHFKRFGCAKYLAKRPRSFEKDNSEQQHEHGVKLNRNQHGGGSKDQMVALLQTWVEDDAKECWFPQILSELSDYDVETKEQDSDWDCADALGIALMRIVDMGRAPRDLSKEDDRAHAFDMPVWQRGADGSMVDVTHQHSKASKYDL